MQPPTSANTVTAAAVRRYTVPTPAQRQGGQVSRNTSPAITGDEDHLTLTLGHPSEEFEQVDTNLLIEGPRRLNPTADD